MVKKRKITVLRLLLGVISVLVGALILAFLTEMLADDVENFLKRHWGEENHLFYLICILAFALVLLLLSYLVEYTEKEETKTETKGELRTEFLKNLKQLYEKRLHDKMLGEMNFEIKLNLKYTTKGNQLETIEDFFIIKNETQAGDFDRLFKKYVDRLWRLLILGEPGSGKSILLLRFGLKLIELAEKDPNFPIPILLDLASWKDKNQTFEYWLEMNLPYIGGSFVVSKDYAKKLIEAKNILLMLDGFDEISLEYRDSCFQQLLPYLQKVKNARKEAYPEVVICSRILEYEAAEDAPVFASVKIQPLTEKDVKAALKPLVIKNFLAAKRLQTILEENPDLYSAITSAFFMHTLLDISQHARPDFQYKSKEFLQKEITESYISMELEKITDFQKDKVKKWLGWLAWKMKYLEGNIAFELIDLQPWWTKNKYSFRLVVGMVCGLVFFLPAFQKFSLIFSLILGLIFGLLFSWGEHQIITEEIKVLELKRMSWKVIKVVLFFSLKIALFCVVFFGLIFSWFLGFVDSLIFGLVIGLIGGLLFGLVDGLSVEASFPKVSNPYKRFFAQFLRDVFKFSFVCSLAIGTGSFIIENSYSGFVTGLFAGAFISILVSPIFKHTFLRLALWFEKVIPLKLVTFLDSASKTGLLIKDGGKWRFRHQLIHDNLADWFEENHPELLRKSDLEKLKKIRIKENEG